MTTNKRFDALNRLLLIESRTAAGIVSSHAYDYNRANQRTRAALADGSLWDYGYDQLGQVVAGKRNKPDGARAEGGQFEYGYDDIGNRTRTIPGDANLSPEDLVSDQYQANVLNQYTYRTSQKGKDKQVVEVFAHDADAVNGLISNEHPNKNFLSQHKNLYMHSRFSRQSGRYARRISWSL